MLNWKDFIDGTQHEFIETHNTEKQDVELVTSGLQLLSDEVSKCSRDAFLWGTFHCNPFVVQDAEGVGMRGTATFFAAASLQTTLLIRNSDEFFIDRFRFIGGETQLRVVRSGFVQLENCSFRGFGLNGVYAEKLRGNTEKEGLVIRGGGFFDSDYKEGVVDQAGISLGSGGEYSFISNVAFKGIPCAARFVDGANSTMESCYVTKSSSKPLGDSEGDVRAAGVYAHPSNTNSGKIKIRGCTINHNEDCAPAIVLHGDKSKKKNGFEVSDTTMLINGSLNDRRQVVLHNADNSSIEARIRQCSSDDAERELVDVHNSDGVTLSVKEL